MRYLQGVAGLCAAMAWLSLAGPAASQEQAGQVSNHAGKAGGRAGQGEGVSHAGHGGEMAQAGHGQAACPEAAPPILSVGDFNGDSVVDGADLKELAERIARRDNVAFFDVNADRVVDNKDLLFVARQVGARSSPLDQELAAVFRATERYRDIRNAIEDGFVPWSPSTRGHGVHWARTRRTGGGVELTLPRGLNYSEEGKLLALFYTVDTSGQPPYQPPQGFSADEHWHYHYGVCFVGLNLQDPSYDQGTLGLAECVPREECADGIWLKSYHMLHVWLYELNACGVFGGVNPRITAGIDPQLTLTRCPGGQPPH